MAFLHGISQALHKLKPALPVTRETTASNVVRKVQWSSESVHLGAAGDQASVGSRGIPGQGCAAGTLTSSLPTLREGSEVSLPAPASPLSKPASSRHHSWAQMLRENRHPGGYPEQRTPRRLLMRDEKPQLAASSHESPSTLRKMQKLYLG